MHKFRAFWVFLFVVLLAGSLVLQNFVFAFLFCLAIIVCSLLFFLQNKKRQDLKFKHILEELTLNNDRLLGDIGQYKTFGAFLKTRTEELERTKAAMTSMTKDVLAERDRLEKARAKDDAILTSVG